MRVSISRAALAIFVVSAAVALAWHLSAAALENRIRKGGRRLAPACTPDNGVFWVFGSHHRTGTNLAKAVVNVLGTQDKGNGKALVACKGVFNGSSVSCIEHAISMDRHIIFDNNFKCASDQWPGFVGNMDGIANLRIVHFIRDLANVTLSSYFYHRRASGNEKIMRRFAPSIFDKPNKLLAIFFGHCQNHDDWGLADECATVNYELRGKPRKDWSLAEALVVLPPELGILVQAAANKARLAIMQKTKAALDRTPAIVHEFDIDTDVNVDFDLAFTHMYEFLGLKDALPTCMKLTVPFDLRRSSNKISTFRKTLDDRNAELKSRLRQILLNSTYWNRLVASVSAEPR